MNSTSLLLAKLLSVSNLTFFLDRLIFDGKYKTVELTFDDAYINRIDFVGEMINTAGGKYTMMIKNLNLNRLSEPHARNKIPQQQSNRKNLDLLQIFKLNYGAGVGDGTPFVHYLRKNLQYFSFQNIVLLIPMQSDEKKRQFWDHIMELNVFLGYRNAIVVFYKNEESISMVNALKKPFEIYAINYKVKRMTKIGIALIGIDVENSLYRGELDEANFHEHIFGMVSKKPDLVINTDTGSDKSLMKTSVRRGNKTLINLGSADYYLSNFISLNLHFKDITFIQGYRYKQTTFKNGEFVTIRGYSDCECTSFNEEAYAEFYNELPYIRETNAGFVFIDANHVKQILNLGIFGFKQAHAVRFDDGFWHF